MFRIVNLRTGEEVASGVFESATLFEKARGLIGRDTPRTLLIRTRWGIHTFGVRFPIDVVVLSDGGIVMKTKKLLPNRIMFWDPHWPTVLELPEGTIVNDRVLLGDRLDFVLT